MLCGKYCFKGEGEQLPHNIKICAALTLHSHECTARWGSIKGEGGGKEMGHSIRSSLHHLHFSKMQRR